MVEETIADRRLNLPHFESRFTGRAGSPVVHEREQRGLAIRRQRIEGRNEMATSGAQCVHGFLAENRQRVVPRDDEIIECGQQCGGTVMGETDGGAEPEPVTIGELIAPVAEELHARGLTEIVPDANRNAAGGRGLGGVKEKTVVVVCAAADFKFENEVNGGLQDESENGLHEAHCKEKRAGAFALGEIREIGARYFAA